MSVKKEEFVFKLNYADKVKRRCAYVKTKFEFRDLEKFIRYWSLNDCELESKGVDIYWFDTEGDQFKLRNNEDYDIFKKKNPTNAALWASISDYDLELAALAEPFQHYCQLCENCLESHHYLYRRDCTMACILCREPRDSCCVYISEGRTIPNVMLQPTLQSNANAIRTLSTNQLISKINEENGKVINSLISSEDEEEETMRLLSVLDELSSERDNNENNAAYMNNENAGAKIKMTKVPEHVENALKVMATMGYTNDNGGLTKLLLSSERDNNENNAAYMNNENAGAKNKMTKVPEHVENALKVMATMGYTNDNGGLTKLLLSTNGQIRQAVDLINCGLRY